MVAKRLGIALGVMAVSISSALYSSAVLANPQRSFPFSVGQPVVLNAGDSAIITLTLTTTDPDEDGEGERIVMSGAAGNVSCTATAADYFVPTVIDCGPVPAGQQLVLNSSYLGFDGDELGMGYAQVNTPEAVKKTQQEIDAWEKIAHADDALAQMYDTWNWICESNPVAYFFCSLGSHHNFGQMAAFERANAFYLDAMAADPPDSNYTQIVQPVLQYDPPMVFGNGIPQNVANDFNALYLNYQQQAGLLFAINTSLNRASGALQAGNTYWRNAQVAAASKYSYQLGALLKLEPGLSGTLQKDLAAAGIAAPIASPSDVYAVDEEFGNGALPTVEQAALTNIGMSPSDEQQVANRGFVQNITEVAGLLSASNGSSAWANSSINSDLLAAASSLQQFAINNGYSPIDCSKAAPSVSVIWSPNHKMVPVGINGVTDSDGSPFEIAVTSIQQDEPLEGEADGSGIGASAAAVRAERDGSGNGRIYQVGFMAEDLSGATCTGSVLVSVPHDQDHPAVDNGQRYNSTGQ